jgi:sugar O-acyltransferase (sialic acid O-acetyltransferase NeuD family)
MSMEPGRNLYVFGASGHGKVVAEAARRSGMFRVRGFLDDDPRLWDREWDGVPVVGGRDRLALLPPGAEIALGVGDNRARAGVALTAVAKGRLLATIVHPTAVVASGAWIGPGSYLGPLSVVHSDAIVGRGCVVNSAAVVEHDCRLEDFVHLSPRAALGGAVHIGEGVHVGLGAVILPGQSIGAWSVLGAGAVLLRSLPAGVVAVGVPARCLPRPAILASTRNS